MKKGTLSTIIGLLLIVAALALTGYNVWDSYEAMVASNEALEALLSQIDEDPVPTDGRPVVEHENAEAVITSEEIEYPDYILNPEMDMPEKIVDGEAYIGVISIESIGLELPVISEWNYARLGIAPCRYTGSAYLDNMVICAHDYRAHFQSVRTIQIGTEVVFTDIDGNRFVYEVAEVETIGAYDIEGMTTGDWDLTLFTCTIGGRTRAAVRCTRSIVTFAN